MCSNDLLNALPAEVYTALDSSSHLDITARAKLHKSIETSGLGNQLDLTIAAPFGYQTSLQHSRNAPWNPLARGLALALAGRYAHVDPTGSVDSDDQEDVEASRLPVLERLRTQWQDMLPTWSSDHEISLTEVGHLWHGVTWVCRERARNAARWMCPEVLAGCVRQVEELKSYPSAVTNAITLSTSTLPSLAAKRRARNKETLTLLLPFWYEHILERQRQDGPETTAEVLRIMTPGQPGPPGAPPAAAPFPAPVYTMHMPYPAPALFHGPPPPPYVPPPPPPTPPSLHHPGVLPTPGPAATAPIHGMTHGAHTVSSTALGFLGIPGSKLVCGADIGFDVPPGSRCCNCIIATNYTGSAHRGFECPLRYWTRFHGCPGWTATGHRIPAAWNGPNLTRQTRDDWTAFIGKHALPHARAMAGSVVPF